ncbi:hypothetical protein [Caulobacter endophyticus]|uniref:hypothetical protein n=1 Tax=Caulobacter endophyticus TaxID=2172652 RepID=UPI00240FC0C6|nr:hypothetical protein [Caulobacter endophyticus]MDG2528680.1 hypothetical protein [Caulobacter endophyticus]
MIKVMYEHWLSERVPRYRQLSTAEREAVAGFLHFWPLFEGLVLDGSASPGKLCDLAERGGENLGWSQAVREALAHYQQRYFPNREAAARFESLRFRRHDRRDLVVAVMSQEVRDPASCTAAVLLILYRLRNNLFHGEKWHYGLEGQQANFDHANQVLIELLEHFSSLRP